MRRLESIEKNNEIKRSWYIQGYDIEIIKELNLPTSDAIKTVIELEKITDPSKFLHFTDDISFEFIKDQKWMLDEFYYLNMNPFELSLAINNLTKQYHELLTMINNEKDKEKLEELRVDLLINDNHYQSLNSLKRKKEEDLKSIKTRK